MNDLAVAVGSTNPTKIEPVRTVFSHHFGSVKIIPVAVESGVSEQPMSDEETYRGAHTRAIEALKKTPEASYGVGIEGGLQKRSYGWFEQSMVVIVNQAHQVGIGSSGGLVLPARVTDLIHGGKTLEEAIDLLFGTTNVGKGVGMFGLMTKGVVTRASGVEHGVAFALARFLHPQIYDPET